MTTASTLTLPADVIRTAPSGVAATDTRAAEAVSVIETPTVRPPLSVRNLLGSATGALLVYSGSELYALDFNRSDSRWYRYVSQRLRELQHGEYDFTGFEIPAWEVIERARFLANSLFEPGHPTPSVVPSEEGDVLYIWHKAGWDLEIDVGLEEITIWAHNRRNGSEWYGALEELRAFVVELLDFLAWH